MPMSFPDREAVEMAAVTWKFRAPDPHETDVQYRKALADFVQPMALIESMEIRTGKGWDDFTDAENKEMLLRSIHENGRRQGIE